MITWRRCSVHLLSLKTVLIKASLIRVNLLMISRYLASLASSTDISAIPIAPFKRINSASSATDMNDTQDLLPELATGQQELNPCLR